MNVSEVLNRPFSFAREEELRQLALYMVDCHQAGDDLPPIRLWYDPKTWDADLPIGNEEKLYVWSQLREYSKLRSTIKASRPS